MSTLAVDQAGLGLTLIRRHASGDESAPFLAEIPQLTSHFMRRYPNADTTARPVSYNELASLIRDAQRERQRIFIEIFQNRRRDDIRQSIVVTGTVVRSG